MTPAVKNDTRTLLSCFRTSLEAVPDPMTPLGLAIVLRGLSDLLRGSGPAGGYVQDCCEGHGPQVVLQTLIDAYNAPAHEMGELEND